MKNLKNLKDAKLLDKREQQAIRGGSKCSYGTCPPTMQCDPLTWRCIRC